MRPDGLVHSDGPAILAGSDAPSLQVPDGFDIFSARFSRDGEDLVMAAEGSPPLTVIGYFSIDSPPALEMPNGAMLRGDVVELLAGPRAPGQYAQADPPEAGEAIGRVETLSGSSTATRVSGETVELAQGDPVFQGDVVETAGESTLGIRLEDGTLASLSAQSRLVLNEFVFETGGSDNWMVVDLVQGAFAFLTGAIAPSGGMEITTPVAVMAIRGTMPVAFVAGEGGASQFFAASDQDYDLLHLTTRDILAVVSSESGFSLSSPDAPLEAVELDIETQDEIDGLLDVLNDAAAELGLLGIQDDSGFHTYTPFGSIDGNLAALTEFLLLLDNALTEEAVLEVEDSDQFLMAQPEPEPEPEPEAGLIASPDQAATDEMSPVVIDVLDNDSHPDNGDLTVVFADVPSGQGGVTVVDGQNLVFDPGNDFDYLALGETTDVVITYVVSDSTGAVASTTATVTLTGINQKPENVSVGQASLDEQTDTQPLEATIPVTFTDVDLNNVGHEAAIVGPVELDGEYDGLTLDSDALTALVTPGTVTKNAGDDAGSVDFAFSAAASVFDYLADGEIVTLTYTFEIDDGDGGIASHTFDVVIRGTNDAPVIDEPASDVAATAVEDGFDRDGNPVGNPDASGQIAASDVDNGGKTFSVAQTNGSFGVFAINAAGAWTYTLDDAAAEHLALGQTRAEVFEVTVTDSFGATDDVRVTVTVEGSNDAPQVQNVALSATEDGAAITGSFAGHDRDSDDNPGTLTYEVTQPDEGAVIDNGDGTFNFDPGDDFQDLGAGETREVTFTYTATDSHGLVSAPATVTVTVTGTNDVPVISGQLTGTVTEDAHPTPLTTGGALTIIDPDADESGFEPQGGTPGSNGHGTFTLLADGTWSYSADNEQSAIQELGVGETLTDSFTAVSNDGTGSETVTVTIHGTNDAPAVTALSGRVGEDGPSFSQDLLSGASDVDASDTLTVRNVDAAITTGDGRTLGKGDHYEITGSTFALTAAGFALFNDLAAGEADGFTVNFDVFDGTEATANTLAVTVTGDNDATVVTALSGSVGEDGPSFSQDLLSGASDVDDSDILSVQNVDATITTGDGRTLGKGDHYEITGSTFALTAAGFGLFNDLAKGEADSFVVDFEVFDGTDATANSLTVTVNGDNDAPRVTAETGSDRAELIANEAAPTSFQLAAEPGNPGYTDGDMATVTFSITRGDGSAEVISLEVEMGSSHALTLPNLIDRINAEDNGLTAVDSGNAWEFTLDVSGGALDADDITVAFHNPHAPWTYTFGATVLEAGADAEGLSASGTLSVSDVDAGDEVDASVVNELTIDGTGKDSLPGDLDSDAFLAMISVGANPVIGEGDTTGHIQWTFDSGDEAFGFLDPNETLVLTYTIAATDSAGALTEHDVTITINGAGSETQSAASSGDLEFSSALMAGMETFDDDSDSEMFVLTETDLTIDDVIIDYQEGDVIDLTQLGFELATGQFTAEAAAEYVDYDQAGGVLSVDMDGAGKEADFEDIAELVSPPPSVLVRLSDGDSTADIEIA